GSWRVSTTRVPRRGCVHQLQSERRRKERPFSTQPPKLACC
ncbi:unnamed protein product, partial [Tetraodon nigroviridis]